MGVFHIIKILLTGIVTSCYFFPFEFTFLPGMNTKMILAGISLLLLIINIAKDRNAVIDTDFFKLSAIALVFSIMCFTAVIFNNTNDHTYSTYIISMWVWLGGAYTTSCVLKKVHGSISVRLVCNYLIVISVCQCLLALLIDMIPVLNVYVNRYIVGFDFVGLDRLENSDRLYGIGAALDVAGTRFATVLIMIAVISRDLYLTSHSKYLPLYLIAFVLIAVVGNMMARTTTVGLVIAVLYWAISIGRRGAQLRHNRFVFWLILILGVTIPYVVNKYNNSPDFKEKVSFAFEGFFSLAESGEWDVASNNNLKNMIVFPKSLKTWIIGDGYLENPRVTDPYYVGQFFRGYYMGTDIGYLRFIFYFGVFTTLIFIFYFYKVAQVCVRRFPAYGIMFWLILLVNYVIWLKVATDIFVVFALFLCVGKEENEEYDKGVLSME